MNRRAEETEERLAELKRTNVPRATYERIGGTLRLNDDATEEDRLALPDLRAALDAHLRHFAWLTDSTGTMLCPGCESQGWFSWGVVHGAGTCSCGWPGTYYHRIADPDPAAPCEDCGKPEDEHLNVDGAEEGIGRSRCPNDPDGINFYRRPPLFRLDLLLWAHPYEVKLSKKKGRSKTRS